MKLKTIIGCAALGLVAVALSGCNDEDAPAIENGLYLAEATSNKTFNQQIFNLTVDAATTRTLTATLAQIAKEDMTVAFELDESLIEAYNEKNGTTYQILPKEYYDFEDGVEAVIPAGKAAAPAVEYTLRPFSCPNGELFAFPLRMKKVSGPVDLVGNANNILLLLDAPNIQKSIVLHRNCKTYFNLPSSVETNAFTIEFWIKVNNKTGWAPSTDYPWFGSNGQDPSKPYRQKIFGDNCGPISIGGVLLRWWADGANKIGPTLQCQLDGGYFDSNEWWEADTWYHIAYVYDGKYITLYRNGAKDKELGWEKSFTFESGSLFNLAESYSQAHNIEVEMAQIRVWTKAMNSDQITSGMSRLMPADADGLFVYWPCNEGEGNVLKGKGKAGVDVTVSGTMNWSENEYNFAHPNN